MNLPFNNEQKMNEIIFANRNKSYGAYAIRSSYNVTMLRALIIICSCVFMFGALAYSFRSHEEVLKHNAEQNFTDSIRVVEFKMKEDEPETKPETKKRTPPPPANADQLATHVKDSVDEKHVALNSDPPANHPADTSGTGIEIPGGPITGTGVAVFSVTPKDNTPRTFVDEDPEFDGGNDALRKFIRENIIYPTIAREVGIEGTVYVSFVVEENGKVGPVKVQRGVGGGCTEEAVRVVGKIPAFKKPGRAGGIAVRCWFNVPISFKLR